MLVGWLSAFVGMIAYGAGSVLQGWAATRAAGPAVVRHPAYVAGLACDGLAWGASILAFRLLPLLVVQALLAGSVAVTVVLARFVLHTPLRSRDVAAIVLLTGALTGLAAGFDSIGQAPPPTGTTGWTLLSLVVVAALLAAGYRRASSIPLALLAGAAFTGVSVSVRSIQADSVLSLVLQPDTWALVGFAVVGTFAYARALERGAVGPATAVLWSVETVLGGLAGLVVFGDQVRDGHGWSVVVAALLVLVGCAVLASAPAHRTSPAQPLPA